MGGSACGGRCCGCIYSFHKWYGEGGFVVADSSSEDFMSALIATTGLCEDKLLLVSESCIASKHFELHCRLVEVKAAHSESFEKDYMDFTTKNR
jgi:hypothetical protein